MTGWSDFYISCKAARHLIALSYRVMLPYHVIRVRINRIGSILFVSYASILRWIDRMNRKSRKYPSTKGSATKMSEQVDDRVITRGSKEVMIPLRTDSWYMLQVYVINCFTRVRKTKLPLHVFRRMEWILQDREEFPIDILNKREGQM